MREESEAFIACLGAHSDFLEVAILRQKTRDLRSKEGDSCGARRGNGASGTRCTATTRTKKLRPVQRCWMQERDSRHLDPLFELQVYRLFKITDPWGNLEQFLEFRGGNFCRMQQGVFSCSARRRLQQVRSRTGG
jgi:hypothetical protein